MSSPAIKLAPERHAQIKAISAALNHQTLSETIAHFVNTEIEKGTIPPGIEGVNIRPDDDGLRIGFDEAPTVTFSDEAVADLASTLRDFTDAEKRAEKLVNMQHNYQIEKKGNGVKLTIPFTGKVTKSFPRDLARDLADLLTT
ncbi:hypothetical protein [Phaeobacter inhibens]|uniref:hypothetical protein n=1 Tax=Phaeobacter inhibens TaxID=221822 RepID=UPI0021A5BF02|nr:hypothetical protein [Phaeobacter inhibens]UWR59106.1 hypothetical protein K4F88_09090 [Phaeobacter inhibens]